MIILLENFYKKFFYFLQKNGIDIIAFFLLLNSAFFPTFIFNKVSLLLIIIILFLAFLNKSLLKLRFTFGHLLIYSFFFYSFIYSIFANTFTSESVQLLFCTSILLLVSFKSFLKINFRLHIKIVGFLISIYTIFLLIIIISTGMNLDINQNQFISKLWELSYMTVGFREIGDLTLYQFQIGSAPLLLISFGLWLEDFFSKKSNINNFSVILLALTIFISGQRALMLFGFLILIITFYLFSKFKYKFQFAFFLIMLSAFTFPIYIFPILFNEGDFGTMTKALHFESFLNQLNILNFLFGNGLGSEYFTMGFNRDIAITEITLLDLSRYMGVPLAFLTYYFFLFPKLLKFSFYFYKAPFELFLMIIYLLTSLTNPVLLNSFGIYILCWYWDSLLTKSEY